MTGKRKRCDSTEATALDIGKMNQALSAVVAASRMNWEVVNFTVVQEELDELVRDLKSGEMPFQTIKLLPEQLCKMVTNLVPGLATIRNQLEAVFLNVVHSCHAICQQDASIGGTKHTLLCLLIIASAGAATGSEPCTAALQLLRMKALANCLHKTLCQPAAETAELTTLLLSLLREGGPAVQAWTVEAMITAFQRLRASHKRKLIKVLHNTGLLKRLAEIAECNNPEDSVLLVRTIAMAAHYMDWGDSNPQHSAAVLSSLSRIALRNIWHPKAEVAAAGQVLLTCMCKTSKHRTPPAEVVPTYVPPATAGLQGLAAMLAKDRHEHVSLKRAATQTLFSAIRNQHTADMFLASPGMEHVLEAMDPTSGSDLRVRKAAGVTLISFPHDNHTHTVTTLIQKGATVKLERLILDLVLDAAAEDTTHMGTLVVLCNDHRSLVESGLGPDVTESGSLELAVRFPSRAGLYSACFWALHAPRDQLRSYMLDKGGLERLCNEMHRGGPQWHDGAYTLQKLIARLLQHDVRDPPVVMTGEAKAAPGPVVMPAEYINNPTFSDVTFIVEGRPFHGHKVVVAPCSEVFKAMFTGGYAEAQDTPQLHITDVSYRVWMLVMTYLYTGQVEVPSALVVQTLHVANRYLLSGLESLCQDAALRLLSPANLPPLYALCHERQLLSPRLQRGCLTYALHHWAQRGSLGLGPKQDCALRHQMEPQLRVWLAELLERPPPPEPVPSPRQEEEPVEEDDEDEDAQAMNDEDEDEDAPGLIE